VQVGPYTASQAERMLYGVPEDGGSSGVGMDGEGGSDRDSGSALSSHDTRRWLAAVDAEEADRRRAFWQRIKAAREVTEVRGKDDDARLRLLVRSLPAEYRDRVLKIVSAEGATDGATSTLASAMERAGLGSAGAAVVAAVPASVSSACRLHRAATRCPPLRHSSACSRARQARRGLRRRRRRRARRWTASNR
jgi:hypothetical protein